MPGGGRTGSGGGGGGSNGAGSGGGDEGHEREQKRAKAREEIKRQLHRGGAGDMREFTQSGGKPFATRQFSAEASTPFPAWPPRDGSSSVHSLATDEPFDLRRALDGKVTLLTVSVRESGFAVLPKWESPFEDTFGLAGGTGEAFGAESASAAAADGNLMAAQSLRLMVNDYG